MGRHSTKLQSPQPITEDNVSVQKRKRDEGVASEELAVDVSAPEPPSKKALRKAKKAKDPSISSSGNGNIHGSDANSTEYKGQLASNELDDNPKVPAFGIWIGNLSWSTTNVDLRNFLTHRLRIDDSIITRVHMPAPKKGSSAVAQQTSKPRNRGFAYVDFSNQESMNAALGLSEELLSGRRILIKNARDFQGRPEKPKDTADESAQNASGNPPSHRVFVGNLGFDTTKEDLLEHFSQCGRIADLHIATFEDSGKCKGYSWVDFEELEGGKRAARGWVDGKSEPDEDTEAHDTIGKGDESAQQRKRKPRKWWVNRLHGRDLRIEFAEDKTLRYKKRFGKDAPERKHEDAHKAKSNDAELETNATISSRSLGSPVERKPLKKFDPRNIRPGAALAATPRSSAAIVEGRGKKVVFD